MKLNITLVIVAIVVGFASTQFIGQKPVTKNIRVVPVDVVLKSAMQDQKVPDVQLITLDGKVMHFDDLLDHDILLNFWASWCGPCRMVGPIIDELSEEYEGKAIIGKVDIDSNQQYAAQFGVRNIPTVLVFKDGELVDRKVGVSSKNDYAQAIDKLI